MAVSCPGSAMRASRCMRQTGGGVSIFGWIAGPPDPPERWDLRARGWSLCDKPDPSHAECRHVLLADVRELDAGARMALAAGDPPGWRMIMIGVDNGAERAYLLAHGCAEVLAEAVGVHELEARARRVADMFSTLPRWRSVGPLTLDLFHRDARLGPRWLALHPREFGLLWRLADNPGWVVTRRQLLRDVWRIAQEPDTNSVEVHVSRLRTKLAGAGCAGLVETAVEGGYRLGGEQAFMLADGRPSCSAQGYNAPTALPSRSRSR